MMRGDSMFFLNWYTYLLGAQNIKPRPQNETLISLSVGSFLFSKCLTGCHGQGKVRFYSRSGSFVSGQGISKSLFKVSEKSGDFMFSYRQGNFVLKLL